jgi:serine/threonine protein kinase
VIGKGGFGRVWKVSDKKSRRVYALKVIDKARVISKKSVQSIMNEKEILSRLCEEESEFIVNMKGAFQDRDNCYLLMDYLEAGDLRYYLNRNYTFSEEQISISPFIQSS